MSDRRAALGAMAGLCLSAGLILLLAVTSAAAPPTLSIAATDATIGGTIHATAQLSESPGATGAISFQIFSPDDPTCTGPALTPEPAAATVEGEDEYSSGNFSPTEAGTYSWSAQYTGDIENEPAVAECAAISTVAKATPGMAGTASDAVVGATIHDEVTVSGGFSPTGEVTFSVYGPDNAGCLTPLETETVPLDGGQAISPDFSAQQAGEFRWTAEYSGDDNNEPIGLACNAANQTSDVGKASPGLTGVATATATVGSPITDTVTVAGGFNPTGQLVFKAFGPADATCSGAVEHEATVSVNANGPYSPTGFSPPSGLYRWTASYSGDGNNEVATLACNAANQTSDVGKASPGLTGVATATATVGSPITDTVTVAGGFNPTGQLVFKAFGPADATCSGAVEHEATVSVNANGPYSPTGFSPPSGLYRWTAEYSGDGNNEAIGLACNAANQSSAVAKATPGLSGVATSTVTVGSPITDSVTISGGFQATGQILFRAFGPADESCAGAVKYEESVSVAGSGAYSPAGFSPPSGLYRWTATYLGDGNNEAVLLACNAANQASAVGTLDVTLTARSATNNTVGKPLTATASIANGSNPKGQITFNAFTPDDPNCSGAAVFSTTANVVGNGSYLSAAFVPARVGTFRWTVGYSGDANHAPATTPCGRVASNVSQASPSITSGVEGRGVVGRSFQVTATIRNGYAPTGTVKFEIYNQASTVAGCANLLAVNTMAVAGNGTVRSAPFVPRRPGRYSFVATYSGDAANQGASEPCDPLAHAAQVLKRTPKVKPRARLMRGNRIAVRAQLSGAASPSGVINFNLYRPGDKRCRRDPLFRGGVTVKSNGGYLLAQYVASKPGIYRLSVGYSGDRRNQRYRGKCSAAQSIRVH